MLNDVFCNLNLMNIQFPCLCDASSNVLHRRIFCVNACGVRHAKITSLWSVNHIRKFMITSEKKPDVNRGNADVTSAHTCT